MFGGLSGRWLVGILCGIASGITMGAEDRSPVRADFDLGRPVGFAAEVRPTLTRLGCDSGGCHGKAGGQNGFALSLFGANLAADRAAILLRSRRGDPDSSLILLKPTAQVPHGGGVRLKIDSVEYRTLIRWIEESEPTGPAPVEPRLVRLDLVPRRQFLTPQSRNQVRVIAVWDDGSAVDVTRLSRFESNAPPLVEVDSGGGVTAGRLVGEAAIVVRYAGAVDVARVVVPRGGPLASFRARSGSKVDALVDQRLLDLGLTPSPPCADPEFARRSALDIAGVLPDPDAVADFEANDHPDKRTRWVDALLDRPEYADFFATKWAAILRNRRALGELSKPGTFGFHGWLRQAIAENWPYDRLVGAIVAGRGDAASNPAVNWYRHVATAEERTDDVAQVFLGTRIGCARCHHHPTERWGQEDYAGFAAFFAKVGTKVGADPNTFRVFHQTTSPPPDQGSGAPPRPRLLGEPAPLNLNPRDDPRDALVAWMTAPENPSFARAVVNRYWKHFLGQGIVEPEDDLRATNPPTNAPLLDSLADDFRAHGFDLKWLIRTITTSDTYARSSLPTEGNALDRGNFARQVPQRLAAEVLLGAIDAVTGSTGRFVGVPPGTRATQLPDDGFASPFLDAFGRPERRTACECERTSEPSLAQALFLLNSTDLEARIAGPDGRAARHARPDDRRSDEAKLTEIYRVGLARSPTVEERDRALTFLDRRRQAGQVASGFEDLIWALLNTKEFLYNH